MSDKEIGALSRRQSQTSAVTLLNEKPMKCVTHNNPRLGPPNNPMRRDEGLYLGEQSTSEVGQLISNEQASGVPRGRRGGESPRAALPKGRHFREKCENVRKNGQIYVKKRTKEVKIRGGTGQKGAAEGAAQLVKRIIFIFWVNEKKSSEMFANWLTFFPA